MLRNQERGTNSYIKTWTWLGIRSANSDRPRFKWDKIVNMRIVRDSILSIKLYAS